MSFKKGNRVVFTDPVEGRQYDGIVTEVGPVYVKVMIPDLREDYGEYVPCLAEELEKIT